MLIPAVEDLVSELPQGLRRLAKAQYELWIHLAAEVSSMRRVHPNLFAELEGSKRMPLITRLAELTGLCKTTIEKLTSLAALLLCVTDSWLLSPQMLKQWIHLLGKICSLYYNENRKFGLNVRDVIAFAQEALESGKKEYLHHAFSLFFTNPQIGDVEAKETFPL